MHHGRPLGVLVGADGRDHGGDAGTDVLAHDDGNGRTVAHLSGDRQGLENAHGSGAGLNDGSEHRPGQHTQNGILEQDEQILERRHIPQPGDGGGHGLHAEHQCGEAQKDRAGILFLVIFAEHVIDDAHKGQHRRKGGGFQQPDEDIAAGNPRQAENPGGDGGADVGTHDHVDGLTQGHQAGVDEAHHHHRGGRGALDHGGHRKTRQQARHLVGGHLPKQGAKAPPCPSLQSLAHHIHAEEKQAQSADQIQKLE